MRKAWLSRFLAAGIGMVVAGCLLTGAGAQNASQQAAVAKSAAGRGKPYVLRSLEIAWRERQASEGIGRRRCASAG